MWASKEWTYEWKALGAHATPKGSTHHSYSWSPAVNDVAANDSGDSLNWWNPEERSKAVNTECWAAVLRAECRFGRGVVRFSTLRVEIPIVKH